MFEDNTLKLSADSEEGLTVTEAKTEPFRVSVYFNNDEEMEKARAVLESVKPGHVHVYNGIIDGWVTQDKLKYLKSAGIDVTQTRNAIPAPLFSSLQAIVQAQPSPADASPPDEPQEDMMKVIDPFMKHVSSISGRTNIMRQFRDSIQHMQRRARRIREYLPLARAVAQQHEYKVRLKERMQSEWRAKFEELGEICAFIPPNLLRIRLTDEGKDKITSLPYVFAVSPYDLTDKVSPSLLDAIENFDASQPPPVKNFEVVPAHEEVYGLVKQQVELKGDAKIFGDSAHGIRFEATLDPTYICQLADLDEVASVSFYETSSLTCDRARIIIGLDQLNSGNSNAAGPQVHWDGTGELVGLFDSGIDPNHQDVKDQVKVSMAIQGASADDKVGHGTHVAGIIAGSGKESSGRVCGVASGAQLVNVGITDKNGNLLIDEYSDLGTLLTMAVDQGAKIINLSWRLNNDGSYDHGSSSVDKFVYEHPDILLVVAVGNDGKEDADGNLKLNTVGTPASAKNVLTVGASATNRSEDIFKKTWAQYSPSRFSSPKPIDTLMSGDPDLPAALNSRGPTDFYSVKPDLLAPGTFILSARAISLPVPSRFYWEEYDQYDHRYAYLGGSSMAAPVVAGAAAILRQFLRETTATSNPSAALLKAILIASGRKIPSIGSPNLDFGYPNFDQGFGRLNLASVLPGPHAPRRKLLFMDVANNSKEALESRAPLGSIYKASRAYRVRVADGATEPLTVVLAWTDFPGKFIQNNLQLEIRGAERSFVGNEEHLFGKAPELDDKNIDGLAYDKFNNVEIIRIDQPANEYRIRIMAQGTPMPPQGYALCVCGELDSELMPE